MKEELKIGTKVKIAKTFSEDCNGYFKNREGTIERISDNDEHYPLMYDVRLNDGLKGIVFCRKESLIII